jgi:hypothetical protein
MRRLWPVLVLLSLLVGIPLAEGDLVERRGEPPPPQTGEVECGGDRVVGVWRGRNRIHQWTYVTTLHIQRDGGNNLRGRMLVTAFTGGGRPPPPCRPGQLAYRVSQPAVGTADGLRVDFRATSYNLDRNICGSSYGYNLDRFTGTIDPGTSMLRAVNNDNGVAVNAPVMFRRLRCR